MIVTSTYLLFYSYICYKSMFELQYLRNKVSKLIDYPAWHAIIAVNTCKQSMSSKFIYSNVFDIG